MKYILIGFFIIISFRAFGQVAITEDKDGYTNVRLEPDSGSEIIYHIKAGQVFLYGEDYYDKSNSWATIYFPKNNYSITTNPEDLVKGYIHKSRIRPLNEIEKYTGSEISFKYHNKGFSSKDKIIDYKDEKWIVAINGLKPWGTDGDKPKQEVEKIEVAINGVKISVPEILFLDIFECKNSFNIYKIGDFFIVNQWNSDGAGAYEITWVIDKNGIKQRLVGTIN